MELRMYGFVNYQLTGIQKGIQFGHAVVEYGQQVKKTGDPKLINKWNDWADNWKTFIILNGGTTNDKNGSINKLYEEVKKNNIFTVSFREPDLGDQMTAFVFIVDERVFNKNKYPDFQSSWINPFAKFSWIKKIGGEDNLFLRNFLLDKKLA